MVNRLFVIVSLGIIGNLLFSLYTTDQNTLLQLSSFSVGYLCLAVVFAILPWFGHCIRLLVWSRFLGHRLRFMEVFRMAVATDIGAAITPSAVGGQPIKFGMLVERGLRPSAAGTLIALSAFEDMLFFIIAIPIALLLSNSGENPFLQQIITQFSTHWQTIIALIMGIFLCSQLFKWWQKRNHKAPKTKSSVKQQLTFKEKFKKTWREMGEHFFLIRTKGKKQFVISMLALSSQWFCRFSVVVCLVYALGLPINPLDIYLTQWLVVLAMTFTPTPGGSGGAEASFYYVFAHLIPETLLGVIIAGWRFLTYYMIMLLAVAILYVIGFVPHQKKRKLLSVEAFSYKKNSECKKL